MFMIDQIYPVFENYYKENNNLFQIFKTLINQVYLNTYRVGLFGLTPIFYLDYGYIIERYVVVRDFIFYGQV